MSASNRIEAASVKANSSSAFLISIYTATVFLSAALLFAVQPMFTKMVLPRFGGSASVWSVAMVFFQGILLLGYAYADMLTRFVRGQLALLIHLAVMLGGAVFLPLAIAQGWGSPPADREQLFLLGLFGASIGFPFFALAANGPLLQAWFARSGLGQAENPYFLYAASNTGSLLALFAYPFVAEPFSTLSFQGSLWRTGYYLLIALIAACGALVFFRRDGEAILSRAQSTEAAPAFGRMVYWVALAFVPSALMIAATTHITTDIAAAPFLWVLPLSLYLISFILVFSQRTFIRQATWIKLQPFLLALIVLTLALDIRTWLTVDVALHLLTFFVTAMICHGLMAATRPQAAYLTRFYFCMSLGGVLGGIFSGLIAPRIFSWIAEYPLLVVAAALARPGLVWPTAKEARLIVAFVAIVGVVTLPGLHESISVVPPYSWIVWGAVVILVACAVAFREWPLRLAVLFAAVFAITRVYPPNVRHLETVRSFFGVHKIEVTADGRFRVLRHGMELHGAQRLTTDDGKPVTGRPELSTYYHPDSPIAEAIDAVQDKKNGPIRAAVIGLGAGSIACLMKPDDHLDYYEIDADVIRIARDANRFSFLRDCKPDAKIVLGDARLTIADAKDARYDVIVVDAFSSDSIPVHLLTREALRIYLSRLNPGGIIITHISNNHLDLTGVVTETAASEKLIARLYDEDETEGGDPMIKFSTVMVLARNDDDFGLLKDWELQKPEPGESPWSDDFSNLLGPLVAKFREDD
ncbi:fused MFS/spermidine synthase [Bradyrhizobium sp.]|uniref:fused MFS/spermidine synthase n=1 Tax=Bradyrhizobium sp. TaxID=376 RepID=UPI003D0E34CD